MREALGSFPQSDELFAVQPSFCPYVSYDFQIGFNTGE